MLFDYQTEKKILVAMISNSDALTESMARLFEDHFAAQEHTKLFRLLRDMYAAGKLVSVITVAEECRMWPGFSLASIMDSTFVTRGEVDYLLTKLEDMRQGRVAEEVCRNVLSRLEREETAQVLSEATEKLFAVTLSSEQREQIVSGKELAVRALEHICRRRDAVGRNQRVIYTGFPKLNRVTGGFEEGDLVILSGPTGSGKSAFCQNIMASISVAQTIPSLYINSEMSEEQMGLRWGALLTPDPLITHTKIRAGAITDEDQDKITDGIERLYRSQFSCLTIPDLRVDKVINILRRFAAKNKIRAAAIDYIGRMDMVSDPKNDRKDWELLLSAARRLKTLAQELKIVVIMVAQVKKDGSLQQASYMENECDLHLRLEPMSDKEATERMAMLEPWNYRLQISKGRNCAKGFTYMQFVGEKLRFIGES